MTLPKNARNIKVNDKDYRWMVGKARAHDGIKYANVVVELPDGSVKTFEEPLKVDEDNSIVIPITPAYVSELITKNNL